MNIAPLSHTERRIYMNHIRRLQAENRVLREVLAVERVNRQIAFIKYWQRIRSRWYSTMDMLLLFALDSTRGRAGK